MEIRISFGFRAKAMFAVTVGRVCVCVYPCEWFGIAGFVLCSVSDLYFTQHVT